MISVDTWKRQEMSTCGLTHTRTANIFGLNCCTHILSCIMRYVMGRVGHTLNHRVSRLVSKETWTDTNSSSQSGSRSLWPLWLASVSSFSFCSQFGTAARKKQISCVGRCWWCWFASKSTGQQWRFGNLGAKYMEWEWEDFFVGGNYGRHVFV